MGINPFLAGDVDLDGDVDLTDFNILKDNFGATAAVLPEPSPDYLALLALLALVGSPSLLMDDSAGRSPF